MVVSISALSSSLFVLVMVFFTKLLLLIILGLMAYYEYLILLPIYSLFIKFVCKTMPSVILMLIDFQSRIYLRGRSFTKAYVKMVSIPFLHHHLSTLPPLQTLLLQLLLHPQLLLCHLLLLLKFCSGTIGLVIQVLNFFILLFNL